MKRRVICTALFILSVLGMFGYSSPPVSAAPAGEGGSPFDPYIIATEEDLKWIAQNNEAQKGFLARYLVQTADITLSGEWTPIGNKNQPFVGNFNGNGYTISGLTITNSSAEDVGLFGNNGGAIKNVSLIDVNISCTSTTSYTGGLIGFNYNKVENCYVTGTITSQGCYTGGLIGFNEGQVQNSCVTGTISGDEYAGGLFGETQGLGQGNFLTVYNCHASVTVSGGYAGGIVGRARDAAIENCYVNGSIIGNAGGLVGISIGVTIKNSYSTANINENKSLKLYQIYGGGLIACCDGTTTISNSYSSGNITSYPSSSDNITGFIRYGGGFIGCGGGTLNSYNSFATGTLYRSAEDSIVLNIDTISDGLIGLNSFTSAVISKCYFVSGTKTSVTPGIKITDSNYYRALDTYSNSLLWDSYYPWNFTAIWTLHPNINNGLPYFGTQQPFQQLTGSGTADAPYLINDQSDLQCLSLNNAAYGGFAGKYFSQTADIALTGQWTPIGADYGNFKGSYDGNGFTISGININSESASSQGLFGYVGIGGTVKNVHLAGGTITGNTIIGGIAGNNKGMIEDCSNSCGISGINFTGGIVGYNREGGIITGCSNTGSVNSIGYRVAGIAGTNVGGVIQKSFNSGNISGNDEVGGVCGAGPAQDSYNTGTVSSTTIAGGITGMIAGNQTISNCFNLGSVIGSTKGGVIGKLFTGFNGTIRNNYFLVIPGGVNDGLSGIGSSGSNTGAEPKAVADMQNDAFTDNLNTANGTAVSSGIWSRSPGLNNGYPINYEVPPMTPSIDTQPTSMTKNIGETAIFTIAATAPDNGTLTYQWQKSTDGGISWNPITDATSESYTTDVLTAADNGSQYRCVVTNTKYSTSIDEISDTVTLTVNPAAVIPSIATQPVSLTKNIGEKAAFMVVATVADNGKITYQWQKSTNGGSSWNPIPDATSASFTTGTIVAADNGSQYRCVVTNTNNATTATANSDAAALTVNPAAVKPTITTQPASVTKNVGETATFTIAATVSDNGTLTYQWSKLINGISWSSISGAASASYTTGILTAADNGNQYKCSVRNTKNNTTTYNYSDAAFLTVNTVAEVPTITTQPSGSTVSVGGNVSLTIAATGTGALTYQWYSNATSSTNSGTEINGATDTTYTVPTIAVGTYYYYCIVTNTDNNATGIKTAVKTSDIACVIIGTKPVILSAGADNVTTLSATIAYTIDKGVKYYYAVYSSEDTPPDVISIKSQLSGKAHGSGNTDTGNITIEDLPPATVLKVYFIVEDSNGLTSDVYILEFTTLSEFSIEPKEITSSNISISVYSINNCKLFAAVYNKSGMLTDVYSTDIAEGLHDINIPINTVGMPDKPAVKLFIVNSDSFKPLCNACSCSTT